ncbi:response regulator [Paenibacillus flagellatus]|nr:response regulator [Paenibacillus flagellatus]
MAVVLVVDDDEMVREYVGMILEEFDYEVETAKDGIAAARMIRETDRYDLVVTDLQMPPGEWGGTWLIEQIRPARRTPFIVLSERGGAAEAAKAIKAGAAEYVEKTNMDRDLVATIEKVLLEAGAAEREEAQKAQAYYPMLRMRLGDDVWNRLSDKAKTILATSERVYHEHSHDTDFDFMASFGPLAKAAEIEANRICINDLKTFLRETRLDFTVRTLKGNVVPLASLGDDEPAMTLGQVVYILRQAVPRQFAASKGVSAEDYGMLIAFFEKLLKPRNESVHSEITDIRSYELFRAHMLGIGCTSPFAVLCRL